MVWSPASWSCAMRQSSQAEARARTGLPVTSVRYSTPSNRSAGSPRAKRFERSTESAPSTLTAKCSPAATTSWDRDPFPMHTRRKSGSSDTDVSELAVRPHGSPPGSQHVTTVTPVGKRPITLLYSLASGRVTPLLRSWIVRVCILGSHLYFTPPAGAFPSRYRSPSEQANSLRFKAFSGITGIVIICALSACDNVDFDGVSVDLVPPPEPEVDATAVPDSAVATEEQPIVLPEGPILYLASRSGTRV